VPDESDFLCGDWVWDPVLRELSHYPRTRKGHAEEPDAVERLETVTAVTLYEWSQQPMQTATGAAMSGRMARVEAVYKGNQKLTLNEDDRPCARKLATTIAEVYGVEVLRQGAPDGRRSGNTPQRDEMGRLRYSSGRVETTLDEVGGELHASRKKRLVGKNRSTYHTNEIRRLDLVREVQGPQETFEVRARVGREEIEVPVAGYTGFEGWADAEEWREFTADLARSLGTEWRDETGRADVSSSD
jgi:hypothetical protein